MRQLEEDMDWGIEPRLLLEAMLMQGAVRLIADNGAGQAGTRTVSTGLSDCKRMGLRSNISQNSPIYTTLV